MSITVTAGNNEAGLTPSNAIINNKQIPLADQGPVIPGRPSIRQFADVTRDDGSLLSASVPVVTTSIPIVGSPETFESVPDQLPQAADPMS